MTSIVTEGEIRVLIADDHPIFRQGLKQVIQTDPRLKVVAEAGNGEEALIQVRAADPQVALLDVDMPLGDGFTIGRKLRSERSSVIIVFLTLYNDEMHLNEALDIGANGYLVKDSAASDVVHCIKTVAKGAHYVSPALSSYLLKRNERSANSGKPIDPQLYSLTSAERRVLAHLADYKTNKQIAFELGVSIRTVENHRANICEKLGLQGSHALARFAISSSRK